MRGVVLAASLPNLTDEALDRLSLEVRKASEFRWQGLIAAPGGSCLIACFYQAARPEEDVAQLIMERRIVLVQIDRPPHARRGRIKQLLLVRRLLGALGELLQNLRFNQVALGVLWIETFGPVGEAAD